jgi:hypothetical protein
MLASIEAKRKTSESEQDHSDEPANTYELQPKHERLILGRDSDVN